MAGTKPTYTEERLISELKPLAEKHGTLNQKIIKEEAPCALSTYIKRHSIREWCEMFGVTWNIHSGGYTEEDLLSELKEIYEKYGFLTRALISREASFSVTALKPYGGIRHFKEKLNIFEKSEQNAWLEFFEKVTGFHLEKEKTFKTCISPHSHRPLFFDGFLKEKNLLIEYQDASHFQLIPYLENDNQTGLRERQERDAEKVRWCKENGINLWLVDYRDNPFSRNYIVKSLESFNIGLDNLHLLKISKDEHYIGIGLIKNGSWSAVVRENNKNKRLMVSKDPLRAALYREGYIKEHKIKGRLNNFTEEDLKLYGLDSWDDYTKLKLGELVCIEGKTFMEYDYPRLDSK